MNVRDAALYRSYALGMKLLGFERSIAAFLRTLDLHLPADASILDVGCGTGIIGLTLLRRFPQASLIATDLNPALLEQVRRNAVAQGVEGRIRLGVSDISQPDVLTPLDGSTAGPRLTAFDMVATGAVIGYSRDQERTIDGLLEMVRPDGYFLNIEMNETLVGRLTSRRYRYRVIPLSRMQQALARGGFDVVRIPVGTFPARLTRTCFLARRT